MPQAYSFYPSSKRRFIGNALFFLFIVLSQTLLNDFGIGYFLTLGGIGLIAAFVFAYDSSLAIKIVNGSISGPSLSGWKQVEFELASIDKRRTKQQSLWNRMNGLTVIYAEDGQKIQIGHPSFDKIKRSEILDALKLDEYP